jgi:hypothetical protein
MLPEIDIWRSASAMIQRYGDAAGIEAARRADEFLAQGDVGGTATWRSILAAIEKLQAEKPVDGEAVN